MLWNSEPNRVFLWGEPVDMRKSFDGLIAVTRQSLEEDPLSGNIYVFVNRRGNYVKLLRWDRTGFVLYSKRLERGKFVVPGEGNKSEISVEKLHLFLDGILLGRRARMR
jgi:transposase